MSYLKSLVLAVLTGLLALPAHAADTPTLTIYTYDSFDAEWGPGPALTEGFEKTCGCTLNWVGVDSSIGALRRAQLEGKTTSADIVLGLDTGTVAEAENTGLFAETDIDTSHLNLPNDWHSDVFVPFDYGYFAFIYDKDKLADPPHSFTQLAAMPENFKIAIQDPRSATPGLGLVLWIKDAYGDKAADIWKRLAPHILTVTRGWSESYDLFLKGEADMVLSYTTSPAYHIIDEGKDQYAAASFDEGHYTQIEVAGVLKSSPHQELARTFLEYLITPEAQRILPTTNWMYPVADIDLPDGFRNLAVPDKRLLMDDQRVGTNTGAWIEEMLGALK